MSCNIIKTRIIKQIEFPNIIVFQYHGTYINITTTGITSQKTYLCNINVRHVILIISQIILADHANVLNKIFLGDNHDHMKAVLYTVVMQFPNNVEYREIIEKTVAALYRAVI